MLIRYFDFGLFRGFELKLIFLSFNKIIIFKIKPIRYVLYKGVKTNKNKIYQSLKRRRMVDGLRVSRIDSESAFTSRTFRFPILRFLSHFKCRSV